MLVHFINEESKIRATHDGRRHLSNMCLIDIGVNFQTFQILNKNKLNVAVCIKVFC